MFKRITQAAVLAGLMSVAPMATAHASPICSTGSLVVCVNFTFASLGSNQYTLTVQYVSSNGGGVLTDYGVQAPPGNTTDAFTAISVSGSGSFAIGPTNCSLQDDACASATSPPPMNGLTPGQSSTLKFSAASTFNGDFSTSLFNAHLQAFPSSTDCSVKIGNGSQYSTATTGGSFVASSGCMGTTTTPEPASMFLLGSGLIGLGGGMAVRRRRTSRDA